MQNKQQLRAEFAIDSINNLGKIEKETANFYAGAPMLILTNGLGQTMAFLLSKKETDKNKKEGKEKKLFDILKEWLVEDKNPLASLKDKKDIDFLQEFNKLSMTEYIEAQNEALRLLEWLKRYAKAFEENI